LTLAFHLNIVVGLAILEVGLIAQALFQVFYFKKTQKRIFLAPLKHNNHSSITVVLFCHKNATAFMDNVS